MQERQRPIANWMKEMIDKHGISGRAWATGAGFGNDTVTRAIRDDYKYVTKATTVAGLADFLKEKPPGDAGAIPSAEALASILDHLVGSIPGAKRVPDDVLSEYAAALRDTLLHLVDAPEDANEPQVLTALIRASMRRRARPGA